MQKLSRTSICIAGYPIQPKRHNISCTFIRSISFKNSKRAWAFDPSKDLSEPRWIHNSPKRHLDNRLRLSNFWITTGGVTTASGDQDATHQLLVRGGFLRQSHAGIFQLLPLGLRVQEKIENLISKHMQSVGANKLALSSITSEALWMKSGRYTGNNPEFFKLWTDKNTGYLLSPTHEEEITQLVSGLVSSYKDLPLRLYQIGRKYRNELRPRRGLLRAREFLMKDLYTFDIDNQAALETYKEVKQAYTNLFDELRIPYLVVEADSGNMGGKLSHEFQCIGVDGEDTVISCDTCTLASNEEVMKTKSIQSGDACPACGEGKVTVQKAIELGHTFHLGTRYSEPLGASAQVPIESKSRNSSSETVPLSMGCHGIGISRLIAAVAESLKDSTGLQWPSVIAPFQVLLIPPTGSEDDADEMYDRIVACRAADNTLEENVTQRNSKQKQLVDVAIDDRNKRMAWKFKDAELIGIPIWVIMNRRGEGQENSCEIRCRRLYPEHIQLPDDQVPKFVADSLQRL